MTSQIRPVLNLPEVGSRDQPTLDQEINTWQPLRPVCDTGSNLSPPGANGTQSISFKEMVVDGALPVVRVEIKLKKTKVADAAADDLLTALQCEV